MEERSTRPCIFCKKPIPSFHNYCDWECNVGFAKKMGGVVHCPNGLPIRSMKRDLSMWEHEHGDHPDYKFPVEVEYTGPVTSSDFNDYEMMCGEPASDETKVRLFRRETHALIYADDSVALTMYEYTYVLWALKNGEPLHDRNWYKKCDYRLTDLSLQRIKAGRYEV